MASHELVKRARSVLGGQYEGPHPRCFAAPGRVNLIGEHTDYNDGYVLPVAINRQALLAVRRRSDQVVRLFSDQFRQSTEFDLGQFGPDADAPWSNYVRGVAHVLHAKGHRLCGLEGVLAGDVPMGAGLSSSAAVEVAAAAAWRGLAGLTLSDVELALVCQQAEREFVGVQCGIMDQFISACGRRGYALLIDCRSLAYEQVALPSNVAVVVCDTKKRRGLVDSQYNERRRECERGVEILRRYLPAVRALRDVTPEQLQANAGRLPQLTLRRCRHVVSENQRVLSMVESLRCGNMTEVGALMAQSHRSLRDDYEVSCAELEAMVEAAQGTAGTIGARMTGAGFGGCAVALVDTAALPGWVPAVLDRYRAAIGIQGETYVCEATDGARELCLDQE